MCLYTYTNHLRWNKTPGIGIWVGPNNNPDFLNSELVPATVIEREHLSLKTEILLCVLTKQKRLVLHSLEGGFIWFTFCIINHVQSTWENNGTSACKLTGSCELKICACSCATNLRPVCAAHQTLVCFGIGCSFSQPVTPPGEEKENIIFTEILWKYFKEISKEILPSHNGWLFKEEDLFCNTSRPCAVYIST